eukprot:GHVS01079266.1.p1 GENE.GHVS01079266.1~~GHVS01079266.1.p1  ORF type:complete len:706 (-),score=136.47 GHVS01079266.1:165-1994(-)
MLPQPPLMNASPPPHDDSCALLQQHQAELLRPSHVPQSCHSHDFESLLGSLVAYRTVSADPACLEELWRAAKFLCNCFTEIGCSTKLADAGAGRGPVVLARMGSWDGTKPAVVLYAHYDVVAAEAKAVGGPKVPDEDVVSVTSTTPPPAVVPSAAAVPADVSLGDRPSQQEEHGGGSGRRMNRCGSSARSHGSKNRIHGDRRTSGEGTKQGGASVSGGWVSDPWSLTGVDGFWYGRGVTDNKGPIVASIFAAMARGGRRKFKAEHSEEEGEESYAADVDIIWVVEGEEENGSGGIEDVVQKHKEWFLGASCVVCMNSYWIDDHRPCIVYGMRGVIDMQVEVSGGCATSGNHSGFHGGAIAEPLQDLLYLTGNLVDGSGRANVPDFYTSCRPADEMERDYLSRAELQVEAYRRSVCNAGLRTSDGAALLRKRWMEPVISVTEIFTSTQSIEAAGTAFRVIPSKATANVSIRFVPDQCPIKLVDSLSAYVSELLQDRGSPHSLCTRVVNVGNWWLGDTNSNVCRAAEKAIESVWGVKPLYVREGGTMPVVRYLQDALAVPALQVPLSQASDGAHLPNERIRVRSLLKGVEVLVELFDHLSTDVPSEQYMPV